MLEQTGGNRIEDRPQPLELTALGLAKHRKLFVANPPLQHEGRDEEVKTVEVQLEAIQLQLTDSMFDRHELAVFVFLANGLHDRLRREGAWVEATVTAQKALSGLWTETERGPSVWLSASIDQFSGYWNCKPHWLNSAGMTA